MSSIVYQISPPVSNEALNALFASAWDNHTDSDYLPVLRRSLLYVCAYHDEQLVGFVNLAWDGGVHTFLLDTSVHADFKRRGIGVQLVKTAVEAARERGGLDWVHVDYDPHLTEFYQKCGFIPTDAGLIDLKA